MQTRVSKRKEYSTSSFPLMKFQTNSRKKEERKRLSPPHILHNNSLQQGKIKKSAVLPPTLSPPRTTTLTMQEWLKEQIALIVSQKSHDESGGTADLTTPSSWSSSSAVAATATTTTNVGRKIESSHNDDTSDVSTAENDENDISHEDSLQLAMACHSRGKEIEEEEEEEEEQQLHEGGRLKSAIEYHEKALEIRRRLLGDDHLDTAFSCVKLATVYSKLGTRSSSSNDRAIEYYDMALSILLKKMPAGKRQEEEEQEEKDSNTTAAATSTNNNNGRSRRGRIRIETSSDGGKKNIAKSTRHQIQQSIRGICASLGSIYLKQQDPTNSLKYYELCLNYLDQEMLSSSSVASSSLSPSSIRDKSKHHDSIEIQLLLEKASILNTMGTIYSQQTTNVKNDHFQKSYKCYDQSLKIREKILGKQHYETLATYNNIGLMYIIYQKEDIQALKYFHDALGNNPMVASGGEKHGMSRKKPFMKKQTMPIDKNEYYQAAGKSYSNIGTVYFNKGSFDESLTHYTKCLEWQELQLTKSQEGHHGRRHVGSLDKFDESSVKVSIAVTYSNMAFVHAKKRNYEKALEYHGKALDIYQKELGEEHLDTATSHHSIGSLHAQWNNHDLALMQYRQALNIRKCILDDEWHEDIVSSHIKMGLSFYAIRCYEEAIQSYQSAIVIQEKIYGTNHSRTGMSYNNIGTAYYKYSEYQHALEFYMKALDIKVDAIGANNPAMYSLYSNIGAAYWKKGDKDQAVIWFQKACDVDRERFYRDHHRSSSRKLLSYMKHSHGAQKEGIELHDSYSIGGASKKSGYSSTVNFSVALDLESSVASDFQIDLDSQDGDVSSIDDHVSTTHSRSRQGLRQGLLEGRTLERWGHSHDTIPQPPNREVATPKRNNTRASMIARNNSDEEDTNQYGMEPSILSNYEEMHSGGQDASSSRVVNNFEEHLGDNKGSSFIEYATTWQSDADDDYQQDMELVTQFSSNEHFDAADTPSSTKSIQREADDLIQHNDGEEDFDDKNSLSPKESIILLQGDVDDTHVCGMDSDVQLVQEDPFAGKYTPSSVDLCIAGQRDVDDVHESVPLVHVQTDEEHPVGEGMPSSRTMGLLSDQNNDGICQNNQDPVVLFDEDEKHFYVEDRSIPRESSLNVQALDDRERSGTGDVAPSAGSSIERRLNVDGSHLPGTDPLVQLNNSNNKLFGDHEVSSYTGNWSDDDSPLCSNDKPPSEDEKGSSIETYNDRDINTSHIYDRDVNFYKNPMKQALRHDFDTSFNEKSQLRPLDVKSSSNDSTAEPQLSTKDSDNIDMLAVMEPERNHELSDNKDTTTFAKHKTREEIRPKIGVERTEKTHQSNMLSSVIPNDVNRKQDQHIESNSNASKTIRYTSNIDAAIVPTINELPVGSGRDLAKASSSSEQPKAAASRFNQKEYIGSSGDTSDYDAVVTLGTNGLPVGSDRDLAKASSSSEQPKVGASRFNHKEYIGSSGDTSDYDAVITLGTNGLPVGSDRDLAKASSFSEQQKAGGSRFNHKEYIGSSGDTSDYDAVVTLGTNGLPVGSDRDLVKASSSSEQPKAGGSRFNQKEYIGSSGDTSDYDAVVTLGTNGLPMGSDRDLAKVTSTSVQQDVSASSFKRKEFKLSDGFEPSRGKNIISRSSSFLNSRNPKMSVSGIRMHPKSKNVIGYATLVSPLSPSIGVSLPTQAQAIPRFFPTSKNAHHSLYNTGKITYFSSNYKSVRSSSIPSHRVKVKSQNQSIQSRKKEHFLDNQKSTFGHVSSHYSRFIEQRKTLRPSKRWTSKIRQVTRTRAASVDRNLTLSIFDRLYQHSRLSNPTRKIKRTVFPKRSKSQRLYGYERTKRDWNGPHRKFHIPAVFLQLYARSLQRQIEGRRRRLLIECELKRRQAERSGQLQLWRHTESCLKLKLHKERREQSRVDLERELAKPKKRMSVAQADAFYKRLLLQKQQTDEKIEKIRRQRRTSMMNQGIS